LNLTSHSGNLFMFLPVFDKEINKSMKNLIIIISALSLHCTAQSAWTLWASGLPSAHFVKMSVAPNHDIFYAGSQTVIYKANTTSSSGLFSAMPTIPVPTSVQNNIETVICNVNSEPIVGIFRSNSADPFLFKFDNFTNTWNICSVNSLPNLGAFCSARAPNGDLWVGTKWAYVYKSIDNGLNFSQIDETPIINSSYPCYYPTFGNGCTSDGAIYSINVDGNGRVYAGTECGGVVYTDDAGITWKPADFHPCQTANPALKDSFSAMNPITGAGNVGAIGFTSNNNVIFNGPRMWTLGWNSSFALADMTAHTVTQSTGFVSHFIASGLQFTKIVTTSNGRIFMHSGRNLSLVGPPIGVYTSTDGINWTLFNTGITDPDDGTDNSSLAVDGNKVFFSSIYGNVWMYDASSGLGVDGLTGVQSAKLLFPNPATNTLTFTNISGKTIIKIYNTLGKIVMEKEIENEVALDITQLVGGIYTVIEEDSLGRSYHKVVITK